MIIYMAFQPCQLTMLCTHRPLILLITLYLMTGCAQNYAVKMAGVVQSHHNGQTEAALVAHDDVYKGQDPDLLYYAERGELLRTRPDGLDDSTKAWQQADDKVILWEDSVRTALTRSLDRLDDLLFNKAFSDYQGQDYEKVQLSTRLAENHVLQGKWEDGRVAIRRMYEREALIRELREREVDVLRDRAERQGINFNRLSVDNIKGYPVQIFDDPQVLLLRNAYQSAASHYLAGFVFEALHEKGLAAAGYRNAVELRPDVPWLRKGLAELDKSRSKTKNSKKTAAEQTDVLFMIETGAIPPRRTLKTVVQIPFLNGLSNIITAYPVVRPADTGSIPDHLTVNDQTVPVAMVTNLDAMARRALQDEMPAITLRNAVSGGVQAVAHVAAEVAMERNDDAATSAIALFSQLGVLVAASLYADANSDTRQWQTLPAYISLARARVNSGEQTVSISTPNGRFSQSVYVDGPYSLVVLHLNGGRLIALSSSKKRTAGETEADTITTVQTEVAESPAPKAIAAGLSP